MDYKQKEQEGDQIPLLCPVCGKRTSENRKGSLTSWIFQESKCTCKVSSSAHVAIGSGQTSSEASSHASDQAYSQAQAAAGSTAHAPAAAVINSRYEVMSLLGEGGMGSVYKVWDSTSNKPLAVKVLRDELARDPAAIKRFEQEVTAASSLTHPNLVAVYDHGRTVVGAPYLVMDYLEGESLAARLKREHCLNWHNAIDLFIQITDALAHAHAKGVVHRDLKPSNIILTKDENGSDFVKIVDFGIAKILPTMGIEEQNLTQTGEIFGSPLYMSPEQCKGEKLDQRSDIYSLGCLMYEVLTGRLPFTSEHPIKTILQHLSDAPPPIATISLGLALPEGLETVVDRCLEKSVYDRYQDMDTLRGDLARIKDGLLPGPLAKMSAVQALIGSEVEGRYRIVRIIGQGGWSTIFEAVHLKLKKTVAVKVLHQYFSRDDEKLERFRREAEAVSRLDHPNIAKIFDFGVLDTGQPYIAMEYFSGRSLSTIAKDDGPMAEGLAVMVFRQVSDALEEVHSHGLVHRDITPGNIFIIDSGPVDSAVKLLDFGLAKSFAQEQAGQDKLTQTGFALGTPAYMSPEQCLGQVVDPRSDIFSLGCVMYQALSGEQPFSGGSVFECMMKRFHVAARPFSEVCPQLHVSQSLEAIVNKAMEPNIEERFQSASALKEALDKHADSFSDGSPQLRLSLQLARLKLRRTKPRSWTPPSRVVIAIGLAALSIWALIDGSIPSAILLLVLGNNSKSTAYGMIRLAEVNQAMGNRARAEQLIDGALAVLRRGVQDAVLNGDLARGENMANYQLSIRNQFEYDRQGGGADFEDLAGAYAQTGKTDKARELYGKFWEYGSATDIQSRANQILNKGYWLLKHGQPQQAEPLLLESLTAFEHSGPSAERERKAAARLLAQATGPQQDTEDLQLFPDRSVQPDPSDPLLPKGFKSQDEFDQFIKTYLGSKHAPTAIFHLIDAAANGGQPDGWICNIDVRAFLRNPNSIARLKGLGYSNKEIERIMSGLNNMLDGWYSQAVERLYGHHRFKCCIGTWAQER